MFGNRSVRFPSWTYRGVVAAALVIQGCSGKAQRSGGNQAAAAPVLVAVAAMDADNAALERVKLELGYCTIRSPIDGRTGAGTGKTRTATPQNGQNEPHYHLKEARAICA